MSVGIIATMTPSTEELAQLCREHVKRQLTIESGATRCEIFISGNTIKLVEQWKTEEDYELHKLTPNLALFKTFLTDLIESIDIEYFFIVENFS